MTTHMIAGNWKMHGTKAENLALVLSILDGLTSLKNTPLSSRTRSRIQNKNPLRSVPTILLSPPFIYLDQVKTLIKNHPSPFSVQLGAQNLNQHDEGAYTGEISAKMLKDIGCDYVLIGHSERRHLFHESNEVVAEKFVQAIQYQLKPILCVGETQQERDHQQTQEIIQAQIETVIKKAGIESFQQAIIAYEPVWAIGTGVHATPEQAQSVHEWMRKLLAQYDKTIAKTITLLYGGSIKPDNASALFAMPDIDGGLIGGASLDAKQFLEIASSSWT